MFCGVSDLIWRATEASGQSAMHTVIFRTAYYLYFVIGCKLQGQAIGRRVKALEKLSMDPVSDAPFTSVGTSEVTAKLEKFRVHLKAHIVMYWFGLCFGTYNVAYLIAVTQKMVPAFLPAALWEELSYLLLYVFLAACILKNLIY